MQDTGNSEFREADDMLEYEPNGHLCRRMSIRDTMLVVKLFGAMGRAVEIIN